MCAGVFSCAYFGGRKETFYSKKTIRVQKLRTEAVMVRCTHCVITSKHAQLVFGSRKCPRVQGINVGSITHCVIQGIIQPHVRIFVCSSWCQWLGTCFPDTTHMLIVTLCGGQRACIVVRLPPQANVVFGLQNVSDMYIFWGDRTACGTCDYLPLVVFSGFLIPPITGL